MHEQLSGQEIDVADWSLDEDFGVYPEGARDKTLYLSPEPSPFPFLLPNHRYLFKRSIERAPLQFWVEIIAYEIGKLIDVNVPPAYAAFNSKTGKCGALIRWFYSADASVVFISGGEYMQQLIPTYDRTKGRTHNFQSIARLGRLFARSRPIVFTFSTWIAEWSRMIVFDALIGNSDRHQDNWGILWEGVFPNLTPKLAPAFDNGTSLGYEILERKFFKFDDKKVFENYLSRGKHHMRWELNDSKSISHFELVRQISLAYPETKAGMQACIEFDFNKLKKSFERIFNIKIPMMLSEQRQHFLLRLIEARQAKLFAILS